MLDDRAHSTLGKRTSRPTRTCLCARRCSVLDLVLRERVDRGWGKMVANGKFDTNATDSRRHGPQLDFTSDALLAIARKALDRDTGARGLRSIIEGVMLDIMYDLPDEGAGKEYVITDEVVEGLAKLLPMPQQKKESA